MRPVTVTAGPFIASSANNIALSQTLGAAGPVTLNGSRASAGVATISPAARFAITSAGNDSGITFAVKGTDWAGNPISETIAGANVGAASSVLDYLTVTSIVSSGATAAAITAGTTGIGASPWVRFDDYSQATCEMQFVVSGTVNYSLQISFDDPNDVTTYENPIARSAMTWDVSGSPVAGATATTTISMLAVPRFGRVLVNSGAGSVKWTSTQYGVAPL
jgi:hypothetical protein